MDMVQHILTVLQSSSDTSTLSWPQSGQELSALLLTHGLLGFYQDALKRKGLWESAPESIRTTVEKGVQAQWVTILRLAELQDRVADLLQKKGIAFLILKGLPLSERLYQHALLRPSGDVDILLRQKDFENGVSVLKAAGFAAQGRGDHFHLSLTTLELPGILELHFQLADRRFHFHPEEIFDRTSLEKISGKDLLVMDPTDELLYLAYHHANHYLLYRFFWLLDVASFLQCFGESIDWSILRERMKHWRIERAVRASLHYAAHFYAKSWSQETRNQVERLTQNANKKIISFLADPKDPFHSRVSRSVWARRILGFLLTDRMSDRLKALAAKVP